MSNESADRLREAMRANGDWTEAEDAMFDAALAHERSAALTLLDVEAATETLHEWFGYEGEGAPVWTHVHPGTGRQFFVISVEEVHRSIDEWRASQLDVTPPETRREP